MLYETLKRWVPRRLKRLIRVTLKGPAAVGLSREFRALYGRAPSPGELERLAFVAATDPVKSPVSRYRSVIAAFDRQTLGTPFLVRFGPDDLRYESVGGIELATDAADVSIALAVRLEGEWEPHMTRFFRAHVKPGMTVADVGANIGYFSMLAATLVGPAGRVFSFEPNSENCRLLLLSLKRNGLNNVRLFPFGLSDQEGFAYFSSHVGSNGGLLRTADQVLVDPNCHVIPTRRFDDAVGDARVDYVKMDVEGAEGLVLRGARKVVERDRPLVTSEFSMEMLPRVSGTSGAEFFAYFTSLGYTIHLITRPGGTLKRIDDPAAFLAGYGEPTRIEDLAFVPPPR